MVRRPGQLQSSAGPGWLKSARDGLFKLWQDTNVVFGRQSRGRSQPKFLATTHEFAPGDVTSYAHYYSGKAIPSMYLTPGAIGYPLNHCDAEPPTKDFWQPSQQTN
jgi:hypothetical protein